MHMLQPTIVMPKRTTDIQQQAGLDTGLRMLSHWDVIRSKQGTRQKHDTSLANYRSHDSPINLLMCPVLIFVIVIDVRLLIASMNPTATIESLFRSMGMTKYRMKFSSGRALSLNVVSISVSKIVPTY